MTDQVPEAAQQLAARIRGRLRVLAESPVLDEVDPSGGLRSRVRGGEPEVSTYHAYAGRLLAEHGLRLPVEPSARLLSETASWQVAHRVVFMDRGEIVESGPPRELFENPRTDRLKLFLSQILRGH